MSSKTNSLASHFWVLRYIFPFLFLIAIISIDYRFYLRFKVLVYSILLITATYILGLFGVNINKSDMGNFGETFLLLQFNGFTFSFCRAPFLAAWYIKRKLVLSVKLRSKFYFRSTTCKSFKLFPLPSGWKIR